MIRKYREFFLLLLAALSLWVSASGMAAAQNPQVDAAKLLESLFTIEDISVDETSSSADRARTIAIEKAERLGYQKLLAKLTQPNDRPNLPEFTRSQLQGLIRGIEIVDEQSSSRRYVATFNIVFEPDFVSDFFAAHSVPHVLSTGTGVAVFHGHEVGLADYLWVPNAAMRQARATIDWRNRIRSYVFPGGDVKARYSVSLETLRTFDADSVLELARARGLMSVLQIHSRLVDNPDGSRDLVYRYKLSDGEYEGEGVLFTDAATVEGEAAAITSMYELILEEIGTVWREQLLVDTSQSGVISAVIPLEDATTYGKIAAILRNLSLVKRHALKSFAVPYSEIMLEYTGREEQLRLALDFNGIKVENYGEKLLLRLK